MLSYSGCRFLKVNSASNLRSALKDSGNPEGRRLAVTIGNFDGMHRGHTTLLSRLTSGADGSGEAAALLTFYPHPQDYFKRGSSPRISTYGERFIRAAEITHASTAVSAMETSQSGLAYFIALRFGRELAELLPEQFVEEVLVNGLSVSRVVVGAEWRFGKGRAGDVALLKRLGDKFGFTVETPLVVGENGAKISSSDLKRVLPLGDLAAYRSYTGRDYEFCGRVIRGDQRGRTIGFRTANLKPKPSIITLKNGVYSTAVQIVGEQGEFRSLTNIGIRPTFAGVAPATVIETHILDGFSRDIYGAKLKVRFLARIRDEKRFNSIDELRTQIAADIASSTAEN